MFGIEFLPQNPHADTRQLLAMINGARAYLNQKVDYVLIPANPRNKASVNALLGAYAMRKNLQENMQENMIESTIECVPTISGAGLDELHLMSQILTLKYAGFESVALIGGGGDECGIKLIQLAREILGGGVQIISGSAVEIWEKDKEQRLIKKLQSGVDRIITQPIFDTHTARRYIEHFALLQGRCHTRVEVSLGVFGVFHLKSAYRINEAHLGFEIPRGYITALEAGRAMEIFYTLWEEMQALAREYQVSLYLSTPKHNDLRAYGNESC